MTDRDAFEARFHAAVRGYAGCVSSDLDPIELTQRIAATAPRHRGFRAVVPWRRGALPRLAGVLLLLALALLATTMAGLLVAGSKPAWRLEAVRPSVGPVAWPTWSPADAADTALVDRMIVVWLSPGMPALEEVFAKDLVFTVEGEVYGGFDGLRQNPPTVSIRRVGDVAVTTDPVPGLWSLPAGSRFLAFVANTSGELRDWVVEVDDEDRVSVFYNDPHVPPDQRARDGYTPVDFTMIAGLEPRWVGTVSRSDARLTLIEKERVDAAALPGCQGSAVGSTYVFLHLRLEGMGLSSRDIASDTVEVRGPGGERLEPISCQREPTFQPATDSRDGWIAVAAPTDAAGHLSLVYRHVNEAPGDQGPEVSEALIPFDLPSG